MEKLYFTFGSDPKYPYGREEYIIAIGTDTQDCLNAYKKKYPNRPDSSAVNCADYYTEAEWNANTNRFYKDVQPKELLISDTIYGKKPEGFAPIWFFVPAKAQLVFLQEGSGDNLLPEDRKEGIVDYFDITAYSMNSCGDIEEDDGGQLLLHYMIQEHYGCLADAIPDVLDFLFDEPFLDAQILKVEN